MTSRRPATSRPFEACFTVIALITMMDAIVRLATTRGDAFSADLVEGNLAYQLTALSVDVMTVLLLATRPRATWKLCVENKSLLLLILLAIVSTSWSSNPMVTLRRSVGLTGTTLFGIYVASTYRPKDFLVLLAQSLAIVAILSFLVAILLPQYGIHSDKHFGAWRGVFMHKNSLGRTMGFSVLLFSIFVFYDSGSRRLASVLMLMLSGTLLILSGSRTAWIGTTFVLSLFPVLRASRARPKLLIPGLAFVMLVVTAVLVAIRTNPDMFFHLLGRDTTLTGRIPMWQTAITAGLQRPFIGYGFRAFWLDDQGGAATLEMTQFMRTMNHSHNGFLDLWLELGTVGLGIFVFILLRIIVKTTQHLRRGTDVLGLWYPIPITYMLVVGITEDAILGSHNILWAVFVATLAYVNEEVSSYQAQESPAPHPYALQPMVRHAELVRGDAQLLIRPAAD